jgi:hypothetical protein
MAGITEPALPTSCAMDIVGGNGHRTSRRSVCTVSESALVGHAVA